jgi:alpha-L-fucosidase
MGSPTGNTFVPAGCDTVMLEPHSWFTGPPREKSRSLASLIEVYHDSVGKNCVLELGIAVNKTGVVPEGQAARAAEFGAWVKSCYGTPLATLKAVVANATMVTLALPAAGVTTDRISIGEDLAHGQLIRAYSISVQVKGSNTWQPFSNGTSVGHKKIDVLPQGAAPVLATAVRLTVMESVGPPRVKLLAAFAPCERE